MPQITIYSDGIIIYTAVPKRELGIAKMIGTETE